MHQFPEITAVRRGPRLFAWRMGPSDPGVRTLLIVHGAGEHSSRYFNLARQAVRRGWQVVGFDLRGHGCSEGVSVHVRRFEDYHDDLLRVYDHFRLQPSRTAIFGHSMGGLVTVSACQTGVIDPPAVGLSAPLLRLRADVPLWKLAAGRIVKRAWPTTRFKTSVKSGHLLANEALREKRASDPLISHTLTAGWFFAVTRRANKIWTMPYDTPTRLVQGTSDKVVDPRGAVDWLRRGEVSATSGRFVTCGRHELFHDAGGIDLFNELLDWFGDHVSVRAEVLPFQNDRFIASERPLSSVLFDSTKNRKRRAA